MIGLALGGGGVKGSWQEGVLSVLLREQKIEFDAIAGVSVGALNGAFLAQYDRGQQKESSLGLEALWSDIASHKVYRDWKPFGKFQIPWMKSVYSTRPLRRLVHRHVNPERIRDNGKFFSVGAVSLKKGEYQEFSSDSPRLMDAVLASSAFPVMFPPVEIDGDLYADGGIRDVTPIRSLLELGCKEVIAVVPHPTVPGPSECVTALDIGQRVIEIMMSEIINNDIHACGASGKVRVIRPKKEIASNSMDFCPRLIKELRLLGIEDARNQQ